MQMTLAASFSNQRKRVKYIQMEICVLLYILFSIAKYTLHNRSKKYILPFQIFLPNMLLLTG